MRWPPSQLLVKHTCFTTQSSCRFSSLVQSSSILSSDGNTALSGFSNTREGDWVCPTCGVLSYSWRNECFNCRTVRPTESAKSLITAKAKSIMDPKRSKRGQFTAKQHRKEEGIVLKEMLQLSIRSKDYSMVLSLADKHLTAKKDLKSSVVATILRVYGKSGEIDKAIDLFQQIGTNPYMRNRPTQYHYSAIITACADNGRWETALQILDDMRAQKASEDKHLKYRQPPNSVIYSAVMNACGRCDRYDKALHVFDTLLSERREGQGPPKDTILFNQALNACRRLRRYQRAYELYANMYTHKIKRDQVTYGTMLSICDDAGDWVLANEIMKDIKYRKAIEFNVPMYSAIIGAFTKGGEVEKALELFNDAKQQQSLILDAPIYSKALFALATMSKENALSRKHKTSVENTTDIKIDDDGDGDDDDSDEGNAVQKVTNKTNHGQKALQLLAEMTTRNLRISAYPLGQAIEVLDTEEMYKEAIALYNRGEKNKIFPPCVSIIKDKKRRLDVRRSSAALCRVKIWSVLESLMTSGEAKHDIMIILGNNNKNLLDFVVNDVLKQNLYSTKNGGNVQEKQRMNSIRCAVQQNGTVLRVPRAVLNDWIAAANNNT